MARQDIGIGNVVIAAFDFDGTLTRRDSMVPFLIHAGGFGRFVAAAISCVPTIVAATMHLTSRQAAKERLLRACLAGLTRQDLEALGHEYARSRLPMMLREQAMERAAWHRLQGHHCILISASLDIYLEPWGHQNGFDAVLASRLRFTATGSQDGKLNGKNCRGEEKVRRLLNQYGPEDIDELYAYGDSAGDDELLALADHSYYRSFETENTK